MSAEKIKIWNYASDTKRTFEVQCKLYLSHPSELGRQSLSNCAFLMTSKQGAVIFLLDINRLVNAIHVNLSPQ